MWHCITAVLIVMMNVNIRVFLCSLTNKEKNKMDKDFISKKKIKHLKNKFKFMIMYIANTFY